MPSVLIAVALTVLATLLFSDTVETVVMWRLRRRKLRLEIALLEAQIRAGGQSPSPRGERALEESAGVPARPGARSRGVN